MTKPTGRPANPCFSSGPCAKRPGWSPAVLSGALLGRSHRSKPGVARLAEVIERSRSLLQMPADYRLGIVAGSDTGAVELALWSLLGSRGVDLLSWENFGEGWVEDVTRQLTPVDYRLLQAPSGKLPDLAAVDPDREGQADRGDLPGRDDQHALDAVRRGCDRLAQMGRGGRRARRPCRPRGGQSGGRRGLGRALLLGSVSRRGSGYPLVHLDPAGDHRSVVYRAVAGRAVPDGPRNDRAA